MYSTNVYILLLEDKYYYIGKSYDVESRYQDHINGTASAWTSLHKPIKIEKIMPNVTPFEEDRIVKQYMAEYGINNVRGGSYTTENLSEEQICFIQREIWNALDRCIRCGRDNHFASSCKAKLDIYDKVIRDTSVECDRCGRVGHRSTQCVSTVSDTH